MQKIIRIFFWPLLEALAGGRDGQGGAALTATEATAAHILETLLQALREQVGARTSDVASWILLDPLDLPVKRPGQEGVGRLCDHSQVEAETSSRRETGALAQTQGDQEDQSY